MKKNGEIPPVPSKELKADVKRLAWQKLQVTSPMSEMTNKTFQTINASQAIFTDYQLDKLSRDKAMKEVYAEVTRQCKLSHPAVDGEMMNSALQEVIQIMSNTPKFLRVTAQMLQVTKAVIRHLAFHEEKRVDGRALNQLRPITCQVGVCVYPNTGDIKNNNCAFRLDCTSPCMDQAFSRGVRLR